MDNINLLGVIVAKKCAQAFSWAYYVKPFKQKNYARQKITEEF